MAAPAATPPGRTWKDRTPTLEALTRLVAQATARLAALVAAEGPVDPAALERHQGAAHALAWAATYRAALEELDRWAREQAAAARRGAAELLICEIGFAEYVQQVLHGIPLSQSEIARPGDWHADRELCTALDRAQDAHGTDLPAARRALADLLAAEGSPPAGPPDSEEALIREQFRRFAAAEVAPQVGDWHAADSLIPDALIAALAELGVFGLTLSEAHGGAGLGKTAMCIVSEELSRASLAVGSLATRSEIAAELILASGTEDQKARFLPALAAAEIIPTAVFTEPEAGSDLAAVRTRARRDGPVYRIDGAKTWATHAGRADLMTVLVRTGPTEAGHRCLSILLADKPRGSAADPFPVDGLSGGEIPTLGYRGMKEYSQAFDGFPVPAANLLGGVEGEGFRQLMATFETARIQTAARGVGVAQAALDEGLAYACDRRQFGKPLVAFARIADKLAMMAVETGVARLLTLAAARAKESRRRADIEAGMAKLLAARVAWANADSTVQIHGGSGYAEETRAARLLVDARILSVFEGTAEIQAGIIARGLIGRRN